LRHALPAAAGAARRASRERAELAAHAKTYAQKLADYPAWPEIDELGECVECEVPPSARPIDRFMEPA
jgi:hypothetical protein